jgi:hypothetical protein
MLNAAILRRLRAYLTDYAKLFLFVRPVTESKSADHRGEIEIMNVNAFFD